MVPANATALPTRAAAAVRRSGITVSRRRRRGGGLGAQFAQPGQDVVQTGPEAIELGSGQAGKEVVREGALLPLEALGDGLAMGGQRDERRPPVGGVFL